MNSNGRYLSLSMSLALVFIVSCSSLMPMAGGGTEDTNTKTIIGKAMTSTGTNRDQTIVRLIPRGYNPVTDNVLITIKTDTTDTSGRYSFNFSDTGVFNIQGFNIASGEQLLVQNIRVKEDSTIVPSDTLRIPGRINIMLPDDADAQNGYVYVPGTTLFASLQGAEGGIITFAAAPPDVNLPIKYGTIATGGTERTLMENVQVSSGGNMTTIYSSWRHYKKAVLNTTQSGANVMSTVYNFPVLIRLHKGNFAFSEAQANGNDIVFTKADNSTLSFEIERWDAGNAQAEIWVRIDTILGNNATQSIIMYWGNSGAQSQSNGPAVFDTAVGFQGVWHLAEATGSNAADATGNGYHGVPSPLKPLAMRSNFSMGKRFDGKSQYITMPNTANSKLNFPENGMYSISAWVKVDSPLVSSRQVLVSKGNTHYALEIQDTNRWAFTVFKNLVGWETAWSNWKENPLKIYTIVEPKWILVTGVRSGNRQYLYVYDGLCTDTSNQFVKSVTSRLTDFDLFIGRVEDAVAPCYFRGAIDEVRISSVVPGRDWVTLCFRNQNAVDELVEFK